MKNYLLFFIVIILILISFSLGEEKSTLLFVGDYNFPPLEYLDSEGNPRGFSVDIVHELSKRINRKIEIKLVPWRETVKLLDSGKVDGIELMRVTEERKKKYDFVTYLESFSIIVVPVDSEIHNFIDLKKNKVAVLDQDVAHIFLMDMVQTIPCTSSEEVLKKVLGGEAEAGVINYYVAKWVIARNGWNDKLKILPDKLFTNYSGIALPKGSPYLLEIKRGIDEIIKSPLYMDLLRKWFGEEIFLRLELKRKETKYQWLIYLISLLVITSLGIIASRQYLKKEVKRQTFEIRELLKENERKYNELIISYNFLKEISNRSVEEIEKLLWEKLKDLFPEHNVKIYKRIKDEFFLLYPQTSKEDLRIKVEDIDKVCPDGLYVTLEGKVFYLLYYEKDIPPGVFDLLIEEFKYTLENILVKEKLEKEKKISNFVNLFQIRIEEGPFLESLLREILDLVDADAGSIMVYDEEDNLLRIVAGIGLPEEVIRNTVLRIGEGIAGWVAEYREPLVLEDVYKDRRFVIIEPRFEIKSSICYPLIHENKLVGVLNINSLRR
ncbi:MAG: transporter substrate-binding domain-containing protein, partial [Dictyoglomus sp.]